MQVRLLVRVLGCATLAFSLVAGTAPVLAAPTIYTVKGHVTDKVTGQPVAGVCMIFGPPVACSPVVTDANGDWTTQLVNGSAWDVWYSKTGYELEKDVIPASVTTDPYILNHQLTPKAVLAGHGS